MKKIIVLVIIVIGITSTRGYAQFDSKWLLGYESFGGVPVGNMDMDFSNQHLDSIYFRYRNMNFEFANASICDSTGSLLFYTNGVYIANALDDTMLNGSGLNPSFYTTNWYDYGLRISQADIILPKPGSDSLYYLFHETIDIPDGSIFACNYLYLSIINMKGDSGKGEVISKNVVLVTDTLTDGSLVATKHANGRDWWLVAPEYGEGGGYYVLLITPDTIEVKHHLYFQLNHLGAGQACFSPDGSKYVWNQSWDHTYFYDFDRCTGLLSNPQDQTYTDGFYWIGASVSPNSRYAYVSHGPYIFQFDLQAANIPASLDTVAVNDGFADPNIPFYTSFVLHQLAPDGKIYISHGNSTFSLHVIDTPDSAGIACNVLQHTVHLPRFNVTIPNFPNYDLGRLQGSPCDTLLWTNLTPGPAPRGEGSVLVNPNPASNSFYIKYDIATNQNMLFVLYDSYGKEVLRKTLYGTFKNLLVATDMLSDGVYFYSATVENAGIRETGKLVIVH